jgi:hypothetical protein
MELKKETLCTRCIHRQVCDVKTKEYFSVLDQVAKIPLPEHVKIDVRCIYHGGARCDSLGL